MAHAPASPRRRGPLLALVAVLVIAALVAAFVLLRDRFGEQKIYLLGESWGTTLGVLAAQARPDLFHAYIGSGQMVSQRETDRIIWRDLLAYADRTGNGAMYDQVLSLGEPPYRDLPWANSVAARSRSASERRRRVMRSNNSRACSKGQLRASRA